MREDSRGGACSTRDGSRNRAAESTAQEGEGTSEEALGSQLQEDGRAGEFGGGEGHGN